MIQALDDIVHKLACRAREASRVLAQSSEETRNSFLKNAAFQLRKNVAAILLANEQDCKQAQERQLSQALQDRLYLNEVRLEAMAKSLEEIAKQNDPLKQQFTPWKRPNGLFIQKVATPLGVIAVIYESRPNVTVEAAGLCIKAGNSGILRSGSDCFHSASALLKCLQEACEEVGLPVYSVQGLGTPEREAVDLLLKMDRYIDVLIPRGGVGLIEYVHNHSRIPVFSHLNGLCHTYIHAKADLEMAAKIIFNAKMRRTSICGATETLLIDRILLHKLPFLVEQLIAAGCELRGDKDACSAVPEILLATEEDWRSEYLDAILAVKTVDGIDDALAHIAQFGSQHTEAIISEDQTIAQRFHQEVDAAIVMHNTSTQFADGGEFGFGAEIGISTGRLHARGPIGANQLTSFKYNVYGSGQCRA